MRTARFERKMKKLQRWKAEKEKRRLEKFLKWRKAMRELRSRDFEQEVAQCSN
jgi:hypothetical protein